MNFALLNAFRREAKDGFFVKGDADVAAVVTEDCDECPNGVVFPV